MPTALSNPMPATNTPRVSDDASARQYWRPPALMVRYQIAKLIGAAFFVVIFTGWLWLQWSSPAMRSVAGGLLVLTVWFTLQSYFDDRSRSRCNVTIVGNALELLHDGKPIEIVPLDDIAFARWTDGDPADAPLTLDIGVELVGHNGQLLAFMNTKWVADHAEVRSFAHWFRYTTQRPFEVRWPEA